MKWLKLVAATVVVLVAIIVIYAINTAISVENSVGFQVVRVESASGPIAVALWYPTMETPYPTTLIAGHLLNVAENASVQGSHRPVIVISHGNNGSALSHVDLAMELASAGYVVVAPTHSGDNFADQSRQASPALFNNRAAELRASIDYVLERWTSADHLDPARVGAFGFSAGGFTVLTLAGGDPNMAGINAHCRRTPEFICDAFAQLQSPLLHGATGVERFPVDHRLRAVVVAAPGLGFTFADGRLTDVQVPVQVWSGDRDEIVPYATNTKFVEEGLGTRAEPHQLTGASHWSFLAPCGLLKPPSLCSDLEGFERQTAHAYMNAEIVRFFSAQLKNETSFKEAP